MPYPFVAAEVLTAANLNAMIGAPAQNPQTGTTYTAVLLDAGKTVTLSNASAVTLTIPAQATVAWAASTQLNFLNIGAGTVTITPAADVTINGTPLTLETSKGGSLVRTASNVWTFVRNTSLISEPVVDYTISSNLITFDSSTGNVAYIPTAAAANFTVNVTNASETDGNAITVVIFLVQGATGYIPSVLQIAAVGQTIKWQGGTAPTPTSDAGKIDVFSFTLIRRSAAWTVLGSALLAF